MIEIIKIIKFINPCIINHQGIKRIEFMKISNLLKIPFITGFCFWNNIIKQIYSNINILENNNIEKDDSFHYITKYSYSYCVSDFVNDVIYKFFNIPPFKHLFTNLEQVKVNGLEYDDTTMGKGMHTIKTKKLIKSTTDVNVLPPEIIKQYGKIKFI